ncbi:iron ABC transporter substrate-binding protein [Marinilabiliaceae bacterium JC017]|nr:iron ABC transporter substrate-binding protein [Marinilabiliaceae bacterium JC017]
MIRYLLSIFCILVCTWSCTHKKAVKDDNTLQPDSVFIPEYAKGFSIEYHKGFKVVNINDPWGDPNKVETYYLAKSKERLPDITIVANSFIKTPVKKWVPFSSTMISHADRLNVLNTVTGVAEPEYISDPYIKRRVSTGQIRNVGMAMSPDIEVIYYLAPDFIMVSPFKDNHYATMRQGNIPIVTNGDYMEHSPLGRAEWLILVGAFFNKEQKAQLMFKGIEARYNELKEAMCNMEKQKSVFTGYLFQGIWDTPAGESYMARFFNDAGANYIYAHTKGTGSLALDFETLYDKAATSDYWILIVNYPGEFSYQALAEMDHRYKDFAAFKNRKVICTNASHSLYFEKGLLEPEVVLNDLIATLYPELFPDYEPVYFNRMQ